MQLASSRYVTHALGVVASLGVSDQLAKGPATPEEIGPAIGADGPTLRRLMRALATVGVFIEDDQGRFANTPMSDTLRSGPNTLRAVCAMGVHPAMMRAWENLPHSVATGASAFEHAHGESIFEYMRHDAGLARLFDDAMSGGSAGAAEATVAALDLSGLECLVDVGGGAGVLLCAALRKAPSLRGVLFDVPDVVAHAPPMGAGIAERCEIIGGDFFEQVPPGADGYMLHRVLHDWDDDRCATILRHVHRGARPGARLFIVEFVVPPGNAPHPSKLVDLQMLVATSGGRERTAAEWEQLLATAKFRLVRIVPAGGRAIVEAERVEA